MTEYLPTQSLAQRRSDRVRYTFRIAISGTESSGHPFHAIAETEVVTRDGGLIVTLMSLHNEARIVLSHSGRNVECRVVGQVGIRGEHHLYGIQFTDPSIQDFWGITIPPIVDREDVGRTVMECSQCSHQEVLHLGEIDIIVFENTRTVPHSCARCLKQTLWRQPVVHGDENLAIGNDAYGVHGAPVHRARNINERKHPRIAVKNIRACLQREGFADDIVAAVDMSRGGIRFLSLIDYQPGTLVNVAVPYMKDGANVFLPARVVRVKCRPTVDIPGEFGLQYIPR